MDRYRAPEPNYDLWWQIALGIFIGMLAHSIVTGLYMRHQMSKAMTQLNAETAKVEKDLQAQVAALQRAAANPPARPDWSLSQSFIEPLNPDERCIQGRRFRRVANGWIHLPNKPCQ